MSNRRGRPPLNPDQRREVRVTVAVTPFVADGLMLYAKRRREQYLSVALSKLLERLARREQELGGMVDCRIQTP